MLFSLRESWVILQPTLVLCLLNPWIGIICLICAGLRSDEKCGAVLFNLMQQMPEHHSSTLSFVMAHLCRISQLQHARGTKEPPMLLVQILCHTLLRPPWERVMWVPHTNWIPISVIEYLDLWLSSSLTVHCVAISSILTK